MKGAQYLLSTGLRRWAALLLILKRMEFSLGGDWPTCNIWIELLQIYAIEEGHSTHCQCHLEKYLPVLQYLVCGSWDFTYAFKNYLNMVRVSVSTTTYLFCNPNHYFKSEPRSFWPIFSGKYVSFQFILLIVNTSVSP